jgi:hypothetical protein
LFFLFRGASPLGLPGWLARGGPMPRSARQAHSLSLVRAYLCSSGKIQFGKRCTGSRVAGSFGADAVSWRA